LTITDKWFKIKLCWDENPIIIRKKSIVSWLGRKVKKGKMKQIKKQGGFTLIELMIVIAIIAILATLGVTNFSSALRRARDAKRQSDIVAVQKALETCNNIATGTYVAAWPTGAANNFDGIVKYEMNAGCLNNEIKPAIDTYQYFGFVLNGGATGSVQKFVLCAELENYAGNYQLGDPAGTNYNSSPVNTAATGGTDESAVGVNESNLVTTAVVCDGSNPVNKCNMFCVVNSQ
jgi:prepilin-type N-terminal cleavage/methylation domain-containing protein